MKDKHAIYALLKIIPPILSMWLIMQTTAAETKESALSVSVMGKGTPVILIPGLMSDERVWLGLSNKLAKHYELHLVSFSGFADQPPLQHVQPYLPKIQEQLIAYVEQHKLHKPAVIGHSLGGFLAFNLAIDLADNIGPIVSVDGLPFIGPIFTRDDESTPDSMRVQAENIRKHYSAFNKEQLVASINRGMYLQVSSAGDATRILEMSDGSDASTVGQAVYELMTTDLRDRVKEIRTRVLLLGAGGALPDQEAREKVKQLYRQQVSSIENARLEFNWESRHFVMYDQPVWLEDQIVNFLEVEKI